MGLGIGLALGAPGMSGVRTSPNAGQEWWPEVVADPGALRANFGNLESDDEREPINALLMR